MAEEKVEWWRVSVIWASGAQRTSLYVEGQGTAEAVINRWRELRDEGSPYSTESRPAPLLVITGFCDDVLRSPTTVAFDIETVDAVFVNAGG